MNLFKSLIISLFFSPYILLAYSFSPVISPEFVITHCKVEKGVNVHSYILRGDGEQWIAFRVFKNRHGIFPQYPTEKGKTIKITEIIEPDLNFNEYGNYLRCTALLESGEELQVDCYIYEKSDSFDFEKTAHPPLSITNIEAQAIHKLSMNRDYFPDQLVGSYITITLEDGSQYVVHCNINTYVDPDSLPLPAQEEDLVYIFDNSLVILNDRELVTELPLRG